MFAWVFFLPGTVPRVIPTPIQSMIVLGHICSSLMSAVLLQFKGMAPFPMKIQLSMRSKHGPLKRLCEHLFDGHLLKRQEGTTIKQNLKSAEILKAEL